MSDINAKYERHQVKYIKHIIDCCDLYCGLNAGHLFTLKFQTSFHFRHTIFFLKNRPQNTNEIFKWTLNFTHRKLKFSVEKNRAQINIQSQLLKPFERSQNESTGCGQQHFNSGFKAKTNLSLKSY